MATMSRVKNTATAHDISKVIRANMTSIDCRRMSNPNLDEVAESYEEFLCELVRLTTRSNAKVVAQGATLAFGGSDQEAAFFWSEGARCGDLLSHQRQRLDQWGKA